MLGNALAGLSQHAICQQLQLKVDTMPQGQ